MLPEGMTTEDVREGLKKDQGQGGSSIGSFLSTLGSSVFSNAKDFLSRMEGGDKCWTPAHVAADKRPAIEDLAEEELRADPKEEHRRN